MAVPFECQDRGTCNRFQGEPIREAAPVRRAPASNRPTAQDKAIIDEAILRGASVDQVMDLLFARALPRTDIGTPTYLMARGVGSGAPLDRGLWSSGIIDGRSPRWLETVPDRVLRKYGETLVGRTPFEARQPLSLAPERIREVEELLPFVSGRYSAYVTLAMQEFNGFNGLGASFVRASFTPLRDPPHVDPYASAEEKYLAMRAAYYRAGWPFIKRDILDHIRPTTFFGVRVGGVHPELEGVLREVEKDIRKRHAGIAQDLDTNAAGFTIHSFVPRVVAGSSELSQHAYGLAIDIDPQWNPQVTAKTAPAFKRATGEDWTQLFVIPTSSADIRKLYARVVVASRKLKAWLATWLPEYERRMEERRKIANDKSKKADVERLDREIRNDRDLAALHTLVTEYHLPTVKQWRAYGVITVPVEIIERFLGFGVRNNARWGGEYQHSKDIMHLELLRVVAKTTRRVPTPSMTDLYHPNAFPVPVNGPK